jgi:LysR family transcriptional regulator, cyn operon transcriptional activator
VELRHLRSFVAVAERGSFSRAAERLHLSQPALSRQIHDFENELGVSLFDRTGRRIQLTSEGQDLLGRSRGLVIDAESLVERADTLKGGQTGILRVGATPMTLESFLPGFLLRYRRRLPDVAVSLVEDGGAALLNRVERGELHLALTFPRHPGLRSQVLFPVRLLAVVARSRRLARKKTVDLSDLEGERLLVLRPEFLSRQLLDATFQVAHIRAQVLLESAVAHTLIALAEAQYGTAIVPSNLRFDRTRVTAVPILYNHGSVGTWLAVNWHPRRLLPPYGETFVKEIVPYANRSHPGREFKYAPLVPRPDDRP